MNVTVLNSIKDGHGNILRWQCTPLSGVHLERVQIGADTQSEAKVTLVMIWKRALGGLRCAPKSILNIMEDSTGAFSLDVGEYIIPGICTDVPEAGSPIKGFLKTHDVLQITAVEECPYGSPAMQHWEVEAK